MIFDQKQIIVGGNFVFIEWTIAKKQIDSDKNYRAQHRTSGPCYISINSEEDPYFEFMWGYHGRSVVPYQSSLKVRQTINFKQFYNQSHKIAIVLRKVEGLIYEVVCGNKKFLMMANQKRHMKRMTAYDI